MNENQIKPQDKICYNCRHIAWLIAVGQGLRCNANRKQGEIAPIIPSRFHTCDLFEYKVAPKD